MQLFDVACKKLGVLVTRKKPAVVVATCTLLKSD